VSLALRAGARLLRPESYGGIVSGGPQLLAGGRALPLRSQDRDLPPSYYVDRGPRTLAGVTASGDLLLVTVDGRAPGRSVGVTLAEGARVMRGLGARDALNLDGGGSTTMVVRGRVVNRPSDPGGARRLSDGVVVVPR
jgi:exopolysaccharide biosynthesis protein